MLNLRVVQDPAVGDPTAVVRGTRTMRTSMFFWVY